MSRHHARSPGTALGQDAAGQSTSDQGMSGLDTPDQDTGGQNTTPFGVPPGMWRPGARPSVGPGPRAWLPVEDDEVLLVTGFDFLQGEVERIVAAAGGLPRVVADVSEAAPLWGSAGGGLGGRDP